ncbi:SKP1/BTB/POz domain-containing protein [Fadolivirus algeromassiliense]|jgi:hypothetical protein|uniref:SKP1/BTB/POz domain-containing protein n=1 Tax=Fadolivirus FV1/VV64 TaxID=3070911 RepID=A0A7D3UT53_9VIRU|nr:SKP1/BTB/POz domain-containing protein [Fadolivirus algeromassiliense]QKF94070.1 SKP1/BTB/POz domain-containing protein [Fadolivirus FV1/VV64]
MSKEIAANLITFIVDDHRFVLHRDTLNKHKNSIFVRVINKTKKDPYILFDEQTNTLYVDRDPLSFAYVIDCLRGYDCQIDTITDINLRYKVIHDFKYFGLYKDTHGNMDKHIIFEGEKTDEDDVGEILKSTENDYNDNETPFLKKFIDLLKSTDKVLNDKDSEPIIHPIESESLVSINPSPKQLQLPTVQNDKLDTEILTSNNSEKIHDFIKQVNNNLQNGGVLDMINALSNDENIKNLIKNNNSFMELNHESDDDSLGFNINDDNDNDDNDNDQNNINIVTDIISNNIISNTKNNIDEKSNTMTNEKVKSKYVQIK